MPIITPVTESVAEGVLFRWMGLTGNEVLAECDVGEHVILPVLGERMLQIAGGQISGRFVLEFNSDPVNMPWFGILPTTNNLVITPGRQYNTSVNALWSPARYFRPRIYSVISPASPPIDVLVFCAGGV